MSPIDPTDLRKATKQLETEYLHLDRLKHQRSTQHRGERVMKPRPGPQAPGNLSAISLDAYEVTKLQKLVATLADATCTPAIAPQHGPTLCQWIRRHAPRIGRLLWASDVYTTLIDQAHRIAVYTREKVSDSPRVQAAIRDHESWHTAADVAILASAATGTPIDRKRVAYWGRSGRVEHRAASDGSPLYRLSDVVHAARHYRDRRRALGPQG